MSTHMLDLLTEALGEICLLVYEDLGRDHGTEGIESLQEITIGELLRQVINEEVGPLGTFVLLQSGHGDGRGRGIGRAD